MPPSVDAVNAVSYAVVDLLASGSAVEAAQEYLDELGGGADVVVALEAFKDLQDAHNDRYSVDEVDEDAVVQANANVQVAIQACETAYSVVERDRKTAEQRAQEAQQAIDSSTAQIAAFNEKNATSGRAN